jgi:hypothetical protein
MRPRTRILAGAGVLAVLVAGALIVRFATYRPMPPEPIYKGRHVSEWVDGTALAQGATTDEVNRALNSMDSNAVPWLIWLLEKNSRGSFDRPLLQAELQLARIKRIKNGPLVATGLGKLSDKEGRRNSALVLLSHYAPRTCFEENAVRAILKSKSPLAEFDMHRIAALGAFTRRPDLVLPTLCAGLTNGATRQISVIMLSRFGSNAIPNVYQMALAEPGSNGPAVSALLYLDGTAWKDCVEEKRKRQ